MPIYAYKCSACGHQQDVLQKISDPLLTVCPACGQSTYSKQVTAAGFQLKGSGWYVTDFRDKGPKPGSGGDSAKSKDTDAATPPASGGESAPAAAGASAAGDKAAPAAAPASPASSPSSTPPSTAAASGS